MLIEVKVKVAWVIDGKARKKVETYIIEEDIFAKAEYKVMTLLGDCVNIGTAESFDIMSLKVSAIKEINTQYPGENTYIVALRDTFLQEDGTEKVMKYKVLLWANNISEAMTNARNMASQGYDMQIDSLREVNYTYLNHPENEESQESEE